MAGLRMSTIHQTLHETAGKVKTIYIIFIQLITSIDKCPSKENHQTAILKELFPTFTT